MPNTPHARRHGTGQGADLCRQSVCRLCDQQNHGYAVGKQIVYGYLSVEHAAPGTKLAVEYFGVRHAATVVVEPV